MRRDVKAGMGLALVVVVVAGWYYTRDNSAQETIALGPEALTGAGLTQPGGGQAKNAAASTAASTSTAAPTSTARDAANTRQTGSNQAASRAGRRSQTRDVESSARSERSPGDRSSAAAPPTGADPRSGPAANAVPDQPRTSSGETVVLAAPGVDSGRNGRSVASVPGDEVSEVLVGPGGQEGTRPAGGAATPAIASSMSAPTRGDMRGQRVEAIEYYRVQPGDTLAKLANVYYGHANYVDLILHANPAVKDPDLLRVGMEIQLPAVPSGTAGTTTVALTGAARKSDVAASQTTQAPAGAATTPANTAAVTATTDGTRTYVVKSGDSFYRIAERELGSGPRWPELMALNRELVGNDPQSLRPGMKLRLPPR